MRTITREELNNHITHGDAIMLIDFSEKPIYHEKHIPTAIHMSTGDRLPIAAKNVLKDVDAFTVVYGPGSAEVAQKLADMGYTNICEFPGGLIDWMNAGYRVEFGRES